LPHLPCPSRRRRRDWHYTHDRGIPGNPFPQVQVEPWTGYTVYPYQYPELTHFLGYLKRRGVAVTFNMHPAAGVQWHEANYPAMARDMGIDPSTGEWWERGRGGGGQNDVLGRGGGSKQAPRDGSRCCLR
jgi:hypothetical protein